MALARLVVLVSFPFFGLLWFLFLFALLLFSIKFKAALLPMVFAWTCCVAFLALLALSDLLPVTEVSSSSFTLTNG